MKYIKEYEDFDDHIWLDSIDKKSPEGYKFQIGDYVKYNGTLPHSWYKAKFDNSSLCIICVVDKNNKYIGILGQFIYVIVPTKAPNSSYETWVAEKDLILATDSEIAVEKYNI